MDKYDVYFDIKHNSKTTGIKMEYWQLIRSKLGTQKVILPTAAGAIMKDNKILLVLNKGNIWQFPGGFQDLNESITETVEREIYEELGLTLKAGQLISVYTSNKWDGKFSNGDEIQNFILLFKMIGDFEMEDIKIQKSEVNTFQFFSLDQIPENTMECCKQKCRDIFAYSGEVILH